jgi:hypothetical protein
MSDTDKKEETKGTTGSYWAQIFDKPAAERKQQEQQKPEEDSSIYYDWRHPTANTNEEIARVSEFTSIANSGRSDRYTMGHPDSQYQPKPKEKRSPRYE